MGDATPDSEALILVVDDDAAEAAAAVQALRASGYQAIVRTDGLTGLIAVEEAHPALVLLAWGLPFLTGDTLPGMAPPWPRSPRISGTPPSPRTS